MKIIEDCEGEIQSNLTDLYEEMPGNFFKHLRRPYFNDPLTKNNFAWNML